MVHCIVKMMFCRKLHGLKLWYRSLTQKVLSRIDFDIST